MKRMLQLYMLLLNGKEFLIQDLQQEIRDKYYYFGNGIPYKRLMGTPSSLLMLLWQQQNLSL